MISVQIKRNTEKLKILYLRTSKKLVSSLTSHFLEYFTSKHVGVQPMPNSIKETTVLKDEGYNVACVTTMIDTTSFNSS